MHIEVGLVLGEDFAPVAFVHDENPVTQLTGLLRRLVRTAEGRYSEPSACIIDAQSVKTSANAPAASQGYDAGKKIAGRKRSIVTDMSIP